MGALTIDLFCGAGGWASGMEMLGVDPADTLGIDFDQHAAATHEAAGFPTLHADLSGLDPLEVADGRVVDGLIASPPCQAFSLAGKGAGRDAIAGLLAHIDSCMDGWHAPPAAICTEDVRADLTLEPLRWAAALNPRWCAFEQVAPTLPAWEHIARVLEAWGYSTWTGVLSAERYGVPQTRKRAILLARRDGIPAAPPAPSHTAYVPSLPDGGRVPEASLFGDVLEPWVSMADALGWGLPDRPFFTYSGVSAHAVGDREFGGVHVRQHLADAAESGDPSRWRMLPNGQTGENIGVVPRDLDQPAATITGVGSAAWVTRRPATTVQTGNVVTGPGHHAPFGEAPGTQTRTDGGDAVPGASPDSTKGVRVTVEQAAALQSFPAHWPWQGSKTAKYRQIGNAVAPMFGAAVLATVLDLPAEQEDAA